MFGGGRRRSRKLRFSPEVDVIPRRRISAASDVPGRRGAARGAEKAKTKTSND
jgi:hypothetical protein